MEKEIYEITCKTAAVIAITENETKIIEENKTYVIQKPVAKIIKESCEYYGSSVAVRLKGSKSMLGMCYKLPIIIESSNEIIFFPTSSPLNKNCSWISLNHIKNYKKISNNVIIEFTGNKKETFPITYESLENQMFRATKLLLILKKRKNI